MTFPFGLAIIGITSVRRGRGAAKAQQCFVVCFMKSMAHIGQLCLHSVVKMYCIVRHNADILQEAKSAKIMKSFSKMVPQVYNTLGF